MPRKTKFEIGEEVTPELELNLDGSAYSIINHNNSWVVVETKFDKSVLWSDEKVEIIYKADTKTEASEFFKITVAKNLL